MKIKYWSDIACPFCYIGSNRMKRAMKEVGIYAETPLEFKAFQLDPYAPEETDEGYLNHFTHGDSEKEAEGRRTMAYIEGLAHKDGLEMKINDVVPVNTMTAHRLIKLAHEKYERNIEETLINNLYKAYFNEGVSVADKDILTKVATESGIVKKDVDRVLDSDTYQNEVVADLVEAQQAGITGAPFFVINNKYAISGAQPYSTFVNALNKIKEMEV